MSYSGISSAVGAVAGTGASVVSLFVSREQGDDPGQITLSGLVLPGITQSIRVSRNWNIESVPIEGGPNAKLVRNLGDAIIEVEQILLDDREVGLAEDLAAAATGNFGDLIAGSSSDTPVLTAVDKLLALDSLHRRVDANGLPVIWDAENDHLGARGIGTVLFQLLDDGQQIKDRIPVRLAFVEFAPVVIESVAAIVNTPSEEAAEGLSPFG